MTGTKPQHLWSVRRTVTGRLRCQRQEQDEYQYLIHTPTDWNLPPLSRIDPYARKVTSSIGNGIIYDPKAFDWGDDTQVKATVFQTM